MSEPKIHTAKFVMDSLPEMIFEGYSDGSDWNGWACPLFLKSEAERILAASEANGFRWHYDREQDAFTVRSDDDSEDSAPEIFAGTTVNINGNEIRLYGVGAYSWIWEETANESDAV